jgi:signal transduction histidine kinase
MEKQSKIKSTVEMAGVRQQLTPESQLLLFRIAQEALSNVRRHSNASEVRILLEFCTDKAKITIEDNGHGFGLPDRLSELARSGKLGILGMSERARLAGGSIKVTSAPGKGTKVVAEVSV